MTATKITCPQCHAVLKPAAPIPVGKKIRCPKCSNVFPVTQDSAAAVPAKKPDTTPARKPAPAAGRGPDAPPRPDKSQAVRAQKREEPAPALDGADFVEDEAPPRRKQEADVAGGEIVEDEAEEKEELSPSQRSFLGEQQADDTDPEQDGPRRRSRGGDPRRRLRKKRSGGKIALLIGCVVAGVVLVCMGGGALVFYLFWHSSPVQIIGTWQPVGPAAGMMTLEFTGTEFIKKIGNITVRGTYRWVDANTIEMETKSVDMGGPVSNVPAGVKETFTVQVSKDELVFSNPKVNAQSPVFGPQGMIGPMGAKVEVKFKRVK